MEVGLKKNNSKKAYQLIKALRKNFQPKLRNLKNAEHRILTDRKDILRRWRDYAKALCHDENNLTNEGNDQSPALPVLELEVEEAIRRLPKNKAAGIDDLPAELLKTDNQQMTKIICQLCNKILESGEWPTDWLRTIFIPMPKVVGTTVCEEHLTIVLISHCSKVLLRIMLARMTKTAEEQTAEEQMGFRKKVGTRNQIFNIRMVIEKAREFNIPLYMSFIDFKTAFDSVRHTALWEIMKKMGVSVQLISSLRQLYQSQEASFRLENELSAWFKIKKGVRQGCPISPICFNFYLEEVMRRTTDETSWVGMRIRGKHVNNLRFANDVVLIATLPEGLQALIDEVDRVSKEFHLEISASKTKIMVTTKESQQLQTRCRGEQLTQVEKFKYLGAIIEQKANCSYEINARLGAARSAFRSLATVWKDRALNIAIKLKILRTVVWLVVMYGCQSWTLRVADINRLQTFEMSCYRQILKISWTQHRTNESVLREIKTERNILETVKRRKLQYFGHVIRTQNLGTHILYEFVEGNRSIGRQRKRWMDDIKQWTSRSAAQCMELARDREAWKKLVHQHFMVLDPQT